MNIMIIILILTHLSTANASNNILASDIADQMQKYRDNQEAESINPDRKSTRLNSSHSQQSRMPSSA